MGQKNQKRKLVKKKKFAKKSHSFKMDKKEWPLLLAVLAITFIAFFPALNADFVNWDDDFNILKNENLKAFDWENIKGIFTSHVIGNYNPLPILSFAIEKAIFGFNTFVFHLNNILLHLLCVYLVYRISRILDLPILPALVVAVLFGIHPMRVESVAWITERKDVLFGFFSFLSILQYLKYAKLGLKKKHFIWAFVFAAFAMLAKIQAVALPLSFLCIDYLLKRPINLKLLLEKAPYFALSLAIGLLGVYMLSQQGSLEDKTNYNIIQRLCIGAQSMTVYLIKFIFPFKMSPLYPYPADFPGYFYASPIYFLAFCSAVFVAFKKNWRPIVFGLLFFFFNVVFMLQIVGAGQGFLADRFTYMPYFGLMFMLAYYWNAWMQKKPKFEMPLKIGMVVYIIMFAVMTFIQTGIWKNSDTLWTHVIKYYTKTPLPFRNRGNYYRDQKQFDKALTDYNKAISLKSSDAGVYNSRAKLFFNQEKYQEAAADYSRAIEIDATEGEYFINRGAAKAALGKYQPALKDVSKGIELKPSLPSGYINRSLLYQTLGQNENAIKDIETYLKYEPYDGALWYELGRLRRIQNRATEAIPAFDQAIQLEPQRGIFYYERSKAFLASGNKTKAAQDLNTARQYGVNIEPQYQQNFQ